MKGYKLILVALVSALLVTCNKDNPIVPPVADTTKTVSIFHFNDPHGSIDNFAKIKYIIDKEKEKSIVFLVCAGDIFSGNPVVDNHPEKGYPMIDLMNKVGVDIAAIGNHEFDYGEENLKNRINQSQFPWVCANVSMNNTGIPEPSDFKTVTKNNVKITFLGLVETNGKEDAIIPSTHPWRVQNLTFYKYFDVVTNFKDVKTTENSDLYVTLSHLGNPTDADLAHNYPYFDLIIGGHSHLKVNTTVNSIPIFQAGAGLNNLGKIELTIKDRRITQINYTLIDLNNYVNFESTIKQLADSYNQDANLDGIIGYSEANHNKSQVGYFYTYALRNILNADLTFQNTGGIRADLDKGDITKREIFTIDPFNNGAVTYTMNVSQIKSFLRYCGDGFYYSGGTIEKINDEVIIKNESNQVLSDNTTLVVGMNDYIPAVHDSYFSNPTYKTFTTAEGIINYLENNTQPVNFTGYNNYFKY